uniref:Uncharacterized protein n=1 Tax=Sparus aurata TaxID=8175 RepID=A0A671V0D0_SPAAU
PAGEQTVMVLWRMALIACTDRGYLVFNSPVICHLEELFGTFISKVPGFCFQDSQCKPVEVPLTINKVSGHPQIAVVAS